MGDRCMSYRVRCNRRRRDARLGNRWARYLPEMQCPKWGVYGIGDGGGRARKATQRRV